ncbi:unnamed protein product [Cylicocyclus nassatus]|uniref:Uncharacterized protein n=1 Tax=Cylicocyclus nassatus TaxID=53992 RepID=A0AA36DTM6_CYLNA|nr:unnamed protein product [Cylicocyclus nassatus]
MIDYKKCPITVLLLLNLLVMFLYISHSDKMHRVDYKRYHIKGHHRRQGLAKMSAAKDRLRSYRKVLDECILEEVDPLAKEFMHYNPNYNPKKNCTIYKPMTELIDGTFEIVAENSTCRARCILPKTHTSYEVGAEVELSISGSFDCDIIETMCQIKKESPGNSNVREDQFKNESVEHYLHMQIREINSKIDESFDKNLPDVYVLVLDSVSTSMAKRALPKTLDFLQRKMKAVQFPILNKVGGNSHSNAFPLMFGKSIKRVSRIGRKAEPPDWNQICTENTKFQSFLDIYKKKGYKTMIAEDSAGLQSYELCKKSFGSEADHIYRPFDLRAKEEDLKKNLFGKTCGESHLYMLDYLQKFMNAYSGHPKIAYVWSAALTRSSMGALYHADDHFFKFFERNQKNLRSAFFFFLGYQGPHSDGVQETRLGRHDNKNPFLVIAIPEGLRNNGIHQALKQNSEKLVTHFDIHATLMDILRIKFVPPFASSNESNQNAWVFVSKDKSMTITQGAQNPAFNKGSSLLRRWMKSRTCDNLPIPVEYCLCRYKKEEMTDERLRQKIGEFIASKLNAYLTKAELANTCLKQEYEQTLDAQQLRIGVNTTLYSMFIRLKPMKGEFTVEVLGTSSGFQLVSAFNRWDHRKRGHCAPESFRPLCQCSSS